MTCSCRGLAELCALCRDGLFAQLRGAAACRGEAWAVDVARRVRLERPWPTAGDKVLAIARRKIEDLTRDPRLREMLATELVAWAARRWAEG